MPCCGLWAAFCPFSAVEAASRGGVGDLAVFHAPVSVYGLARPRILRLFRLVVGPWGRGRTDVLAFAPEKWGGVLLHRIPPVIADPAQCPITLKCSSQKPGRLAVGWL